MDSCNNMFHFILFCVKLSVLNFFRSYKTARVCLPIIFIYFADLFKIIQKDMFVNCSGVPIWSLCCCQVNI